MSSGQTSIVVNLNERAVSSDVNRLQALQTRGVMEALRWLLDVFQGADEEGAASSTEYATSSTPSQGEILGGLCVVPQVGALGLGVTDGLALIVDPDASPSADDSAYKHVADAGGLPICYSTAGSVALQMTPNSSSDIRIDVIECARVQDPNPEEDSRDVFNPTTSLFTATTLTKTTGSVFQYRVRLGANGAGFPGAASGWLPLCVASVPPGTTTNDTITFWDVRPLVNDRARGPANVATNLPHRTKLLHSGVPSGSSYLLNGLVELTSQSAFGTSPSGRRLGGTLRRGSPGSDALYALPCVDLGDAANQEAGYTNPGSGLGYFYLLRMFGLPRWARYTDASSGSRVPRGPRGIPLLSLIGPNPVYGSPSSALTPPAVFGFNGATTLDAVCFGATQLFTEFALLTAGETTSDGWTSLGVSTPVVGTWDSGTSTGTVTVTENAQFPAGATRVRMRLQVSLSVVTGGPQENLMFGFPSGLQLQIQDSPVQSSMVQIDQPPHIINTSQSSTVSAFLIWDFDVPLPTTYPVFSGTPLAYELTFNLTTIGSSLPSQATFSSVQASVLGFKYE